MAANKVSKVKSHWFGGRIDDSMKELIEEYIDAREITAGHLIRKAITEYIKNNPVTEE